MVLPYFYPVPDDDRFKISFSMVTGMKLVYPLPRGYKTGLEKPSASQTSRRVVKPSHMSVTNLKKHQGESKTKLQRHSPVEPNETSAKAKKRAFKIPVKILTPQQERARKLSQLVEELNKESIGKGKKVKQPLKSFDAVVAAALGSLREQAQNSFVDFE